jgi:hypothetical protein
VQIKPSHPAPLRDFVIRLDSVTPMHTGGVYRVSALNVRGLLGAPRSSERIVTVARADTGKTFPARPPQNTQPPRPPSGRP